VFWWSEVVVISGLVRTGLVTIRNSLSPGSWDPQFLSQDTSVLPKFQEGCKVNTERTAKKKDRRKMEVEVPSFFRAFSSPLDIGRPK
jgi:hypothetical protein